jgi:hypothetical protein
MTLLDEDIQAARRAVSGLERATDALLRHYGDTVDVRRLKADVSRIGADLDLLCGTPAPPSAATPAAPPPQREKIPDTSYTHDFWMDAEDEGLGHGGGPRR